MALNRNLVFLTSLALIFSSCGVYSADKPKPFVPGIIRRHGAFVQKWEGIDDIQIDKLLQDSRYPYLPTWSGYLSNFAQPSDWGDNYGSRIRTYFVPQQTGYHVFYLQSNNQGRLYMSPDVNEHHKSLIATVSGIHHTSATDVNKFDEQKSFPILLEKGKYYYMEALMKEKFNADVLDVAVKTPDGKMHIPITSEFLWTAVEDNVSSSSSSHHFMWRLAIRTAARFGYAAGQSSGATSGAKAGAKAGKIAGKEFGAKVGAEAGRNIAKNIMTKAITLALKADPRSDAGVINLFTDPKQKVIVAKGAAGPSATSTSATDPSSLVGTILASAGVSQQQGTGAAIPGAGTGTTGAGSGSGTTAAAGAGGGAAAAAIVGGAASTSGTSQGSSTLNKTSSNSQGGSSSITTAGSSGSGTSQNVSSYGIQSQLFPSGKNQVETVVTPFLPLDPDERVSPAGFINPKHGVKLASLNFVKTVIEAKPGEDPMVKARASINRAGFANQVVKDAYYKIISIDHPAEQAESKQNLCFQSVESKVTLTSFCHVFRVRDGLNTRHDSKDIISFESACVPGYYLRQKNYKFVLAQPDNTRAFEKSSTFLFFRHVETPDAFEINIAFGGAVNDWIICETPRDVLKQKHDLRMYAISNLFGKRYVKRCSFYIQPLPSDESPLQNCKNVVDVSKPTLPNHKQPLDGMRTTPVQKDLCVAVNFINKAGIPFELQTDLSDEPFLINQGNLLFREVVKKPKLHHLVMFRASDPTNKYKVLLSGASQITLTPKDNCGSSDNFTDVVVTLKPVPQVQTESSTEKVNVAPVHNHYHYHPPPPPPPPSITPPPACPSICTSGPVCPSTCSQVCCKKDDVTYVEAKSTISKNP